MDYIKITNEKRIGGFPKHLSWYWDLRYLAIFKTTGENVSCVEDAMRITESLNSFDFEYFKISLCLFQLIDIKVALAGYIECKMDEYLADNNIVFKGKIADDFINNRIFFQCLGKLHLCDWKAYIDAVDDRNPLEIFYYFDWDKYCEYYYNKVSGNKVIEVSFCDKAFIVLEIWPNTISGYFCSGEVRNMVFHL